MSSAYSHDNKRIAKNTLMLYFRMLITLIIALYASRVILQVLGASDFGLNNVVAGFVSLFTFVNSTLAIGTQRFLTYSLGAKDEDKLRKVFATALVLHISFSLVFLVILETIGVWFLQNKLSIPLGRESAAFWVFQFAVFSTAVQFIQVPYSAALAAHENFKIYAYMSIYDAAMKLLIVFLIQMINTDKLILYSILFTMVSLSSTLIYNIYCRKNFQECNTSIKLFFDKSLCKEMGIFSGWNVIGCTAFLMSGQGVNTLLNIFLGTIVNAARGISVQVTAVANQLVNNFLVAVNPQIVKLYAEKKYDEMFSLAMNASKYGVALMLWICIPLISEMDYVLTLWLGNFPEHTVVFSKIALLQAIVMSNTRPLITILHATGKMKWPSIVSGSALLLILPITYVLLRKGLNVDIIVSINIIPWICEFIFSLYFVKKYTGVNTWVYFPKVVLKILFVAITPFVCIHLLKSSLEESFGRVVLTTLSCTISLGLCVYMVLLNSIDRIKVVSFIKKKLSMN